MWHLVAVNFGYHKCFTLHFLYQTTNKMHWQPAYSVQWCQCCIKMGAHPSLLPFRLSARRRGSTSPFSPLSPFTPLSPSSNLWLEKSESRGFWDKTDKIGIQKGSSPDTQKWRTKPESQTRNGNCMDTLSMIQKQGDTEVQLVLQYHHNKNILRSMTYLMVK